MAASRGREGGAALAYLRQLPYEPVTHGLETIGNVTVNLDYHFLHSFHH
jgi:hypothetical protein